MRLIQRQRYIKRHLRDKKIEGQKGNRKEETKRLRQRHKERGKEAKIERQT